MTEEEKVLRYKEKSLKYPYKIAGMLFENKIYHCLICSKDVEGFKDKVSSQEFRISGMCQDCQDKTFKGDIL